MCWQLRCLNGTRIAVPGAPVLAGLRVPICEMGPQTLAQGGFFSSGRCCGAHFRLEWLGCCCGDGDKHSLAL